MQTSSRFISQVSTRRQNIANNCEKLTYWVDLQQKDLHFYFLIQLGLYCSNLKRNWKSANSKTVIDHNKSYETGLEKWICNGKQIRK